MLSNTSIGSGTSGVGELPSSFFRLDPLGIRAAAGKLSVEPLKDATDSDDVLELRPGLRGSVLGPSWTDLLGAGEKERLGVVEGVDWLDCAEKRSSHMPRIHVVLSKYHSSFQSGKL